MESTPSNLRRVRALAQQQLLQAGRTEGGAPNRKVVLKSNPQGEPKPSDFEIVSEPLPPVGDGQMLLKTKWLTLDPYMRGLDSSGFMNNAKNPGTKNPIVGGTVSEVVESKNSQWKAGDLVVGYYGWQEYAVASATDVQWGNKAMPIEKWDGSLGQEQLAVSTLGMTGYTAYVGLYTVSEAKAGETVVVSAASGAVGQVVGQLAKIRGCRAVGVAGGKEKCDYCVKELGFDACVDYKAGNLAKDLAAACPNGIDVYFENVGGEVLGAVIPLLSANCRVPVCGWVSQYNVQDNNKPMKEQTNSLTRLAAAGLTMAKPGQKIKPREFRFFGFVELSSKQPDAMNALKEMSGYLKSGQLKYRESVTQGLDSAPGAFIGMLKGQNFGKTMVKF